MSCLDEMMIEEVINDFDYQYTDEVVCPNCGYQYRDSWEFASDYDEIRCDCCGDKFKFSRNIEITYISEKIGEKK